MNQYNEDAEIRHALNVAMPTVIKNRIITKSLRAAYRAGLAATSNDRDALLLAASGVVYSYWRRSKQEQRKAIDQLQLAVCGDADRELQQPELRVAIVEFFNALEESRDPRAIGSTCNLIRTEERVRDILE